MSQDCIVIMAHGKMFGHETVYSDFRPSYFTDYG